MKRRLTSTLFLLLSMAGVSLAIGNPAMIPKHPGHPMSELKDPVTGMPLANDPGQQPWTGSKALEEAAVSYDEASLENAAGDPSLEYQGAGILPKTKGYPEYKIEPPVTEAINPNK